MSIHNRYITDIDRYFSIFPSIDCRLLISCQEGLTLEISTIYHDIFVPASRKGKTPQMIVSNTSSDDGDDRANRGDSNIGGDSEDREETSGDNGVGGGIEESGAIDSGYVNQVDHGISWAQRNKNYYATQDTDHGYRPGIWEQRKHLERLTTFPSDDDYSSGHDYRSNCNQIYEHF